MPVEPLQSNRPKPVPTFGEPNSIARQVYEKLSKSHLNAHEQGWCVVDSVPLPEKLQEWESERAIRFVSRLAETLVAKNVITEAEVDELLKGVVPQTPQPKAPPSAARGHGADIPPFTEVKQFDWQQEGYDWRQHAK